MCLPVPRAGISRDSRGRRPPGPESVTAATQAPATSQLSLALHDLAEGARTTYLWGRLGWQDIRRRYRRSVLGPFWITISMGILVAILGTLYGELFKVEATNYVPYLTLGFVIWTLVNGLITDGCAAFVAAGNIIRQSRLPLSVHVYRVVWRNLIVFFHNAVIFVVVAMLFSVRPGWTGLLAIPGMVLLCLNGVWVGLLLGAFAARFRDVPPIVASIVRIAFFVTPIIWMPALLPERAVLPMSFNPFYHVLEVVRAPLLGQVPDAVSWLAMIGITLVGIAATFVVYVRYRWRIAYWI